MRLRINDRVTWSCLAGQLTGTVVDVVLDLNAADKVVDNSHDKGGTKVSTAEMSCSPYVKNGKKIIHNSCYTSDTLEKLKLYYNKKNPKDPIDETDPKKLWYILKLKLVTCKGEKEDCWLKLIDDEELRKEIDEEIFAPDAPPEWTTNPDEWLSNYDISKVLKQYEETYPDFTFIEPSPIDFDKKPKTFNAKCVSNELCGFSLRHHINKGKTKIGFVFNLDEHTKGGSHWVSMFLDIDEGFIFYFNSTGEEIPKEVDKLKDRIVSQALKLGVRLVFIQNHPTAHQRGNTECGMYCLYFIITLLTYDEKSGNKHHRNHR